jgi:hypothetical protein
MQCNGQIEKKNITHVNNDWATGILHEQPKTNAK